MEMSYSAKCAQFLVRDKLARELNEQGPDENPLFPTPAPGVPWNRNNLPSHDEGLQLPRPGGPKAPKEIKLCIVGAGMAGLYIALILDKLNIPGVSYEILEASERVGGRCFTHEFSSKAHDYYDAGAMRFPDNYVMTR